MYSTWLATVGSACRWAAFVQYSACRPATLRSYDTFTCPILDYYLCDEVLRDGA